MTSYNQILFHIDLVGHSTQDRSQPASSNKNTGKSSLLHEPMGPGDMGVRYTFISQRHEETGSLALCSQYKQSFVRLYLKSQLTN